LEGVRVGAAAGLGVVDRPGEGLCVVGRMLLRKSLLRVTFWIDAVFLKTDGFAGVERGVEGVEALSWAGVLSPVLLSSFCGKIEKDKTLSSVFGTSAPSDDAAFPTSYPH